MKTIKKRVKCIWRKAQTIEALHLCPCKGCRDHVEMTKDPAYWQAIADGIADAGKAENWHEQPMRSA